MNGNEMPPPRGDGNDSRGNEPDEKAPADAPVAAARRDDDSAAHCDDETDVRERLRELEIKITFLDESVSQQTAALLDISRRFDRLTRALRTLAEKTDALAAAADNAQIPPADERPPHW